MGSHLRRIRENEMAERWKNHPATVHLVDISFLTPRPNHSRKPDHTHTLQVAASIEEYGYTNPVLATSSGMTIAGHTRVAAMKLLGHTKIPVIFIDHLTDIKIRAYVLADNQLAVKGKFDWDVVALDLQDIILDDTIDLNSLGFAPAEIDGILEKANDKAFDTLANAIPNLAARAVSRLKDRWKLGLSYLTNDDATSPDAYLRLMAGEKARLCFADVPYNDPIKGHVSGLGAVQHREFPMASGEMSEAEFIAFLGRAMELMTAASVDGALHYICIDWRHLYELLTASRDHYSELKNICTWNKTNGGMGSFYRSKSEFIAQLKVGSAPHVNNVQLGRHGRNRTNVWDYPGVNTFRAGRMEDLAAHPTVKPVELVADVILDASRRKDIVLDPFVGSGTTIIAAERTGRRAYAMELDPLYVDTSIRRWQAYTGEVARLADTGQPFDEVAEEREASEAAKDVSLEPSCAEREG